FQRLGDVAASGDANVPLALAGDDEPGRVRGGRFGEHVINGDFVFRPLAPIAPVVFGDLPPLVRIALALVEPAQLFVFGNVKEELDDRNAVGREHSLELVDFVVGALPLVLLGDVLDALDQYSAVPAAIEEGPGRRLGQLGEEAIEVMSTLLVGSR